jgi:hypothetical protein
MLVGYAADRRCGRLRPDQSAEPARMVRLEPSALIQGQIFPIQVLVESAAPLPMAMLAKH